MIILSKDGLTKFLDDKSALIQALKSNGWKAEGESDNDDLRAEALALGLKPHHKLGADKLAAMIAEAKSVEAKSK